MGKCRVVEYLEGSLSDGGAETLVKDYALMLNKDKFDVSIVVDWIIPDSANYLRLKDSGVDIISLYPRRSVFWRAVNKFFREQYIDLAIKRTLKRIKPDVLHIHLSALHHVVDAGHCLDGIRLFYTCHSIPEVFFDSSSIEYKSAERLKEERGLRFIALHSAMAEEINKKFSIHDTEVIKNGIDLQKFRCPSKTRSEVRRSIGIDDDVFLIGNIGRFSEVKNHRFLVDVFQMVLKKEHKARLLLVGRGELEEEIREYIRKKGLCDKVVILSSRTDIPEILSSLDVFVVPSLFEGLSIVSIEAQAVGIRSVLSTGVPSEAYVSNLAIPLSLDEPLETWCDVILDRNMRSSFPDRLEEYDMKKEIHHLENLYLNQ